MTVKSNRGSQDMQKQNVPKKTEPPFKVKQKPVEKEEQLKLGTQRKKIETYLQTPKGSSSGSDEDIKTKKNSFQAVFESVIAKGNGNGEKKSPQKRSASTSVKKSTMSVTEKGDNKAVTESIVKSEPDIKKRKMIELPNVSFQDQVIQNAGIMENSSGNLIVMKQENLNQKVLNYLGTNISPNIFGADIQKSFHESEDPLHNTSMKVKNEINLPTDSEKHKDIRQELIQLTHDIISQQSGKSQRFIDNGNSSLKTKSTSLFQQDKMESNLKMQPALSVEFGKNAPSSNLTFSKLALQANASKYKSTLGPGSDMNLQSTINRLSTALHTKAPIQKTSESNILFASPSGSISVQENLSVDVGSSGIITPVEVSQAGLRSPVVKQGLKSPPLQSKQAMLSPGLAREALKSPNIHTQQHNPNIDVVKIQSPKGMQSIVHVQSTLSPTSLNKSANSVQKVAASSALSLTTSNRSSVNAMISPHLSPPLLSMSPPNTVQNISTPLLSPPNIVQNTLPSPSMSNVSSSPPLLSPAVPSAVYNTNDPVAFSRPISSVANVGVIQVNPSFSAVNGGSRVNSSVSLPNNRNQVNPNFSSISDMNVVGRTDSAANSMVYSDRNLTINNVNPLTQRNSLINTSNQVIAGNSGVNNVNQLATTANNFNSSNLGHAAVNYMNPNNLSNSAASVVNMSNVNSPGGVIQTTVYSTGQVMTPPNVQMISNQGVNQTMNSGMFLQQQPLHAQAAAHSIALQSNNTVSMNRLTSPQMVTLPNQNFLGQVPLAVTLQGNNSTQVMPQSFMSGSQHISGNNGQNMQQRFISNGNQTFLVNLPVVGTHITTTISTGNVGMPTSTNVTSSLPQGKSQVVGQILIQDPKTKTLKIVPSVLNPNILKTVNPNTKQVKLVAVKSSVSNQVVTNSVVTSQQSKLLIPVTSVKNSTNAKVISIPGSVRQPTVSELLKASANQTVAATALSTIASVQGGKLTNKPDGKLGKPILVNLPVAAQSDSGITSTQSLLGGLTSQRVVQSVVSTSVTELVNSEIQNCVSVTLNNSLRTPVVKSGSGEPGALTVKVNTSSSEPQISPKKLSPNKTVQLVPQPIVPISQAFSNSYTATLPTSDDQPIHNYAMPAQLFEEDSNDAKPPSLDMEAPMLEIEAPILKLENELEISDVKSDPETLIKYSEVSGSNVSNLLSSVKPDMNILPKYPVNTVTENSQTLVQTTSYSTFVGTGDKPNRKRRKSGTRETANKDNQDQVHKQKIIKVN